MKSGKRPTKAQKKTLIAYGCNPNNWLIVKNMPNMMLITHRETGRTKTINL